LTPRQPLSKIAEGSPRPQAVANDFHHLLWQRVRLPYAGDKIRPTQSPFLSITSRQFSLSPFSLSSKLKSFVVAVARPTSISQKKDKPP
jgi:hypothetical protein